MHARGLGALRGCASTRRRCEWTSVHGVRTGAWECVGGLRGVKVCCWGLRGGSGEIERAANSLLGVRTRGVLGHCGGVRVPAEGASGQVFTGYAGVRGSAGCAGGESLLLGAHGCAGSWGVKVCCWVCMGGSGEIERVADLLLGVRTRGVLGHCGGVRVPAEGASGQVFTGYARGRGSAWGVCGGESLLLGSAWGLVK